jgi:cytochrome c5
MKKVITIVFAIGLFGFFLASCDNSGTKEAKKETKKEVKKETKATLTANLENGKVIYNKACIACHWKGVAGAAALTDKTRWEEIAAKGMSTIHQHAIKGYKGDYGVMPEKGTCTDCSDQDMYDAIGYMLNEAGVTAQ